MDEEIEPLVVAVRADTRGFAGDLATMRAQLDGPFGDSLARAGTILGRGLSRALADGRLGFDDLRQVALSVLGDIAAATLQSGLASIGLPGGGSGSGIVAALGSGLAAALGLPGRATGGPVAPGRAYLVGERGPELFLPASSGRIEPAAQAVPAVTLNIHVAGGDAAPDALRRSSRQVARAVRRSLAGLGD